MPTINTKEYRIRAGEKSEARKSELSVMRHRVYASTRWRNLRALYLNDHPLCEVCLSKGITMPAEDVHHIESFADHLEHWQAYAYDYDNLQAICKTCHGRLHHAQQMGEDV